VLATGKLNAVRAPFKAGVTLSRIARQFGLSHSDVRKALASDHKRLRRPAMSVVHPIASK
jgi:transposase-like protein